MSENNSESVWLCLNPGAVVGAKSGNYPVAKVRPGMTVTVGSDGRAFKVEDVQLPLADIDYTGSVRLFGYYLEGRR